MYGDCFLVCWLGVDGINQPSRSINGIEMEIPAEDVINSLRLVWFMHEILWDSLDCWLTLGIYTWNVVVDIGDLRDLGKGYTTHLYKTLWIWNDSQMPQRGDMDDRIFGINFGFAFGIFSIAYHWMCVLQKNKFHSIFRIRPDTLTSTSERNAFIPFFSTATFTFLHAKFELPRQNL